MRPEIKQVKSWVSNCKKVQLDQDDPLYVPLHKLELQDGRTVNLRGEDWLAPLHKNISLSEEATCQLFSGFSGTGKTTELLRLKNRLSSEGYVVLMADATNYLDLNHPLAIEDLTVILAASFGDAYINSFPKRRLPLDGYWQRFRSFMEETDVKLTTVGLNKIVNLKAALYNGDTPMWQQVRTFLKANLGSLKLNAHAYIQQMVDQIREETGQEVVFILDSLEKLRGRDAKFHEIMDSVVQVFSNHHDILRLPDCHVIYTVPPYAGLQGANLSGYYDNHLTRPLPAVKVVEQNAHALVPSTDGILGLRQVLNRRVPLDQIFGEQDELLESFIMYSGGNLRYLLGMLQQLIVDQYGSDFPVDDAAVQRVIGQRKEDRIRSIRPDHVALLSEVLETHDIQKVKDEQLVILARYLDAHMVLCYQNGKGWFQLHPLIVENVRQRIKAERGGSGLMTKPQES